MVAAQFSTIMPTELQFKKEVIDNRIRRSAILSQPDKEDIVLWMEVPSAYENWVVSHNDPLLVLALFHIMEIGGECRIRDSVDRVLLENLTDHMRIWQLWCPERYQCATLIPDAIVDRQLANNRDEALVAFSGGVDASFTLFSHLSGYWGDMSLKVPAAIMIHGADIRLHKQGDFDYAFARAKESLDELNVELIPVRTNYKETPHNWSYCHCVVVAAALSLFGERFCRGLFGSNEVASKSLITYSIPFGMNYVTEHLLNSSSFICQLVGYGTTRSERCEIISSSAPLMKHLRVCWQADSGGGNCGVCEKCMRTYLNFMAIGHEGALPFENPFSVQQFRKTPIKGAIPLAALEEIIEKDNQTHALPKDVRKAVLCSISKTKRRTALAASVKKHFPWLVPALVKLVNR